MMKKRWLMVPILASLLLTGVIATGAVMVQEGDGDGGSPWDRFTGRVAEILGVDEAQVQDAIKQASREMQDEAVQKKLDRLVEAGRLTQEQADEYRDWYQSRPDELHRGPFKRFGGGGFGGRGRHHFRGWHSGPPPEDVPSGPTTASPGAPDSDL